MPSPGLPLTSLTTLVGVITMFSAWFMIRRRIGQNATPVLRQVRLLAKYFLCFGIFFLIVWLPHLSLLLAPERFSMLMAWGYVVGHIFLYIAFIYIGRLVFSMVPKLAAAERFVVPVGVILLTLVTVFNAITMIWGTQPVYDYNKHVDLLNANPLVGAAIGIMGALTMLPAGILFLRNAARSEGGRRTRSLLLGSGFVMNLVAGPPHDVAPGWQVYMTADVLVIVSVIITTVGVFYRFEEGLAPTNPAPVPAPAPQN